MSSPTFGIDVLLLVAIKFHVKDLLRFTQLYVIIENEYIDFMYFATALNCVGVTSVQLSVHISMVFININFILKIVKIISFKNKHTILYICILVNQSVS